MKLRLEKGSVKLRLTPSEIRFLAKQKSVSESLLISVSNTFTYSVEIVNDRESLFVTFAKDELRVWVPDAMAKTWFSSKQVGVRAEVQTDSGDKLLVVIEEDLPPRKKKITD